MTATTSSMNQGAIYVYEAPVRLWHWIMTLAIVVLMLNMMSFREAVAVAVPAVRFCQVLVPGVIGAHLLGRIVHHRGRP